MRASIDRHPRLERLKDLGEHTSPATLVLPSLVIDVRLDGYPAPTTGGGGSGNGSSRNGNSGNGHVGKAGARNGRASDESKATTPGEPTMVTLRGELDALTAARSAEFLLALLDAGPPSMVIDVAGLTFCDASGLGAFVRLANRADAAGGGVVLAGVGPMLAKQLRITGLDRRFAAPT